MNKQDVMINRRFKPYPKYKDSGVEWLGEVPEGWDIHRLKHIATINSETLREDTDPGKEIVYIDIGGVDNLGRINNKQVFAFDSAPSRARRIVRDGDVIISTVRTYLRAIAPIKNPELNMIVSTGFAVVRHGRQLRAGYISYCLRAPYFVDWIVANSKGVSFPAINESEMATHAMIVPPISEQTAISSFLDRETAKIDALAAKKERLIELLQEKRTALITRAVTKGFYGVRPTVSAQAKFKDSGVEWLGEVPEGWKILKLKRIAFIDYGIGLELDRTLLQGTPIISLPNIPINGELDLSDVPFVELNPYEKKYLLLKKGDLLFNWRNGSSDHVGKTALFNEDGEYTHVSFLLRIRFKSHELHSNYFHRYLNSLRYAGFFLSTKAGVNNTFNQSELKEMVMIVPPIAEQIEIADFIEKETLRIDKMINIIQNGIEKLKEYRTALISAAVTGKIDIRES